MTQINQVTPTLFVVPSIDNRRRTEYALDCLCRGKGIHEARVVRLSGQTETWTFEVQGHRIAK